MPAHLKLTLTYDNGTEMAQHKLFTKNTNGLIRDYFPKGTDFNTLTKREILHVQDQINQRPRKTLEYEPPINAISRL